MIKGVSAQDTAPGQVEQGSNAPACPDRGMKIGKLHCPPVLPLRDTFVSETRPPAINFTYLPLSRLSPAFKLKIASIVIARRARFSTALFFSPHQMFGKVFNSVRDVAGSCAITKHGSFVFSRQFNAQNLAFSVFSEAYKFNRTGFET